MPNRDYSTKLCTKCNIELTENKNYKICPRCKQKYFKKATKAIQLQIIEAIQELLLSCAPRRIVLQYVTKEWGIKTRQIDIYIKKANERIYAKSNETTDDMINKALKEREQIAFKAEQKGDMQTALRALSDRDRIKGIIKNTVIHEGEIKTNSEVKIYIPDNKRKNEEGVKE